MSEQSNGLSPKPLSGTGFHRLPQMIPSMNRTSKVAQSKTSAHLETVTVENVDESAVIHIEGTDKVIKINSDGQTETVTSLPDDPPEPTQKAKKVKKTLERKIAVRQPKKQKAEKLESPRESSTGKNLSDSTPTKAPEDSSIDTETPKSRASKRTPKFTPKAEAAILEKAMSAAATKTNSENKNRRKSLEADFVEQKKWPQQEETKEASIQGKSPPLQGAEAPVSMLQPMPESTHVKGDDGKEDASLASKGPDVAPAETMDLDENASSQENLGSSKETDEGKFYFTLAGRVVPRRVLLKESERPSDAQLARIMEGKTNDFDVSHPVKYHTGDLLWGHVGGHPYWPGMITSDPFSGLYTTMQMGLRPRRIYHIQYFGDECERGWIGEGSSLVFEGKKKFEEKGAQQIKVTKDPKQKNKLKTAFIPNQRRKQAWDLAVDEAEDALTLDKEACIEKYTFIYEFVASRKTPKVELPPKVALSTSGDAQEKRGRKRKEPTKNSGDEMGEDVAEVSAAKRQRRDMNTPVTSRPRAREEGSFETYCIKHRESVKDDHPEYSGIMVIQALKQQWSVMTPQQRLKYKSKFSTASYADSHSTGSVKKSPRKGRPSLKKVEADEDAALTDEKEDTSEDVPALVKKRKQVSEAPEEEKQQPPEGKTNDKVKPGNDSDAKSEVKALVKKRKRVSEAPEEEKQQPPEGKTNDKVKPGNDSDAKSEVKGMTAP